jgi:AraC family transcriptional regulator of adaptative response / methylphosphotriester-DNA alkyltransferase methyltransferase
MATTTKVNARQQEITTAYLHVVDEHLADLVAGRVTEMYEIRDIAKVLHIHPTHLTDTVKEATGLHPCAFYQDKILAVVKAMLEKNELPINSIATTLTYDPSNFTKFFKRFTGLTPKQYRENHLAGQMGKSQEIIQHQVAV